MKPLFITGIGTGIGKSLVSAILVQALEAEYWKPVQAGLADGTDTAFVQQYSNIASQQHKETYRLQLPASPHIAARAEGLRISLDTIAADYQAIMANASRSHYLVIEGAGGLMVPLNENEFVIDLIKKLQARVVLVSRNYLGSINHSLLTAAACKANGIDVAGWVFNDQYMQYEQEIAEWTGYPVLASIPLLQPLSSAAIREQAMRIKQNLLKYL
ncbi:MAG TPA: dethiobiotin synthase [Chitinophagaceae bacterium]|nr:dethiobiotin synthase [Chitinophagaceae bacterium]